MGNLFSSEKETSKVAVSDPVYKACENSGEYYNGTSCVSFPTQSLNTNFLKLSVQQHAALKGQLADSSCTDDMSENLMFFDNMAQAGNKCRTCGLNENYNEDSKNCVCDDGYKRNGDYCDVDCSGIGQLLNDEGTACVCDGSNDYVKSSGDGFALTCSKRETYSNRNDNEKMMMLLLVLVLLYVYRRQVQIFVKKTVNKF